MVSGFWAELGAAVPVVRASGGESVTPDEVSKHPIHVTINLATPEEENVH